MPDHERVMPADGLGDLVATLRADGYTVVGPTVVDDAIVLREITSAAELPHGHGVELEAGRYRLRRRADAAVFGHAGGPQSWKHFLHPPRLRLWSAHRDTAQAFSVTSDGEPAPRYAFLGVRGCDLRAIGILDTVLAHGAYSDPHYASRRLGLFIVAVACTEPGATCFCASMDAGPDVSGGYDLALTEIVDDPHRFLVRIGSPAGAALVSRLSTQPADPATVRAADHRVAAASAAMGRSLDTDGLAGRLAASLGSPRWDDVAARCLTCGNCTMVCPTCFCTTVEDVTDLTGTRAERWRRADSCFDLDFSYLHGGSVRTSGRSRYRQWLTHKLGTWHDQFGTSGCVGCGRCIVWCPVGIDITEEAAAVTRPVDEPAGYGVQGPRHASQEKGPAS